jgi:intergrase/recombinase
MRKIGVMRPRKDGTGYSLCVAKEENVGKRRCVHILTDASFEVVKQDGINFINITGEDTELTIKATEKKVKDYISALSNALTQTEKDEILKALRK